MQMKPLPGRAGAEQIFAIGDIHGQASTLEKALAGIARSPRDGRPSRLIFTGDVIDRGPENLRAVDLVMNAAELARVETVTLLPGNHELMLIDSIRDPHRWMNLWAMNGGIAVINEMDPSAKRNPLNEIARMLEDRLSGFIDLVEASPDSMRIGDLLFVHAGVMPGRDVEETLALPRHADRPGREHWAWIREPFLSHRGGWDEAGHLVVIHGHTPHNANLKLDPALAHDFLDHVEDRRRICIDAGAAGMDQIAVLTVSRDMYGLAVYQDREFNPNFDRCPLPGNLREPENGESPEQP